MSNGLTSHNSQDVPVTSVCSPGTSYWCISESTDSPFLLSPIPGPSTKAPPPSKHTPGRDHRRYYHEYWRSEYLMDFEPQRQGMICMVCGSSLATLKLSTIKRHINQKHPYSLLWTESDKDVIRSGWESHLNRENSQPLCPDPDVPPESQEILDVNRLSTGLRVTPSPPSSSVQELPGPTAQVMERYLNDSLHAWFRQEFLMEYQAEEGRLVCMVCSCLLPSLHLDHIKSHMLDLHPNSLLYSAEEKHSILQTWAKTHGEGCKDIYVVPLSQLSISISHIKVGQIVMYICLWFSCQNQTIMSLSFLLFATEDPQSVSVTTNAAGDTQVSPVKTTEQGCETEDNNSTNITPSTQMPGRHRHYPGKDQRRNYQARWKMDFLMDYDCRKHGLICMVCGATLATLKVSTIKRHILQVHPHSLDYNPEERQLVLLCYNQISAHFHSDDCFLGSNHGHKENANGNAYVNTECTTSQST
uniref:Si:dkey-106g10.7 n=1 Tax=Cyprinus carpio TaxID=7962 RepID=A0A8C2EY24_CYPCA